ncbi:RING finger domain protein [Indivirus ILV1]|uniref:RING finger domain protein n=1 Tax=Indivirus ILV1 TaxID=1977633 RepID=A0A1V0SE36_9VIRU|nr:RING finger domain protein [Indivirus ILV1]
MDNNLLFLIVPFNNIINSFQSKLEYYPSIINFTFLENTVLVYADEDCILELPSSKLIEYQCNIQEFSIVEDLQEFIYQNFNTQVITLRLDRNHILFVSFDDELTIEVPIINLKFNIDSFQSNKSFYINGITIPTTDESNITISKDDTCKICMDKDVCTINLPCGHLCFCMSCCHTYVKDNKKECPLCKTELTEIKRFYK